MEEGIKETLNTEGFYGQGTELLNSSLIKREEMSAILQAQIGIFSERKQGTGLNVELGLVLLRINSFQKC